MFDSLYSRPGSLALASICAVAIAIACALISQSRPLAITAAIIAAASMLRVGSCLWFHRSGGEPTGRWARRIVPMVALFYAASAGMLAMLVLVLDVPANVKVLGTTYAAIFSIAVSVSSAGHPRLALAQSLLAMTPAFLGCLWNGSPALLVLAACLPLLVISTHSLTLAISRIVTEQYNIAERYRLVSKRLRHQAMHDELTGLHNRAGLDTALAKLYSENPRAGAFTLLWLDLVRFKTVNDTLGYGAGDALLREMARRLKAAAPEGAILARFASDEFILAAPLSSRQEAERLAMTISQDLACPVRIRDAQIESGATIGVALMPEDATNLPHLMKAADLALFQAKANGSRSVQFFEPELTRRLIRRKEMESDLRAALGKDELTVFFQPVIDLANGRIRSFEALVRWFHPEKGEITPDEFIPVAEETGLIITLGNWITARAAQAAARWPEDVILAVNLSPVQIKAPGAALGILSAVREAGLSPERLELEVTESLFLEDDEGTRRFMEHLGEAGIRFALDDFGTGYSSLNYISKYPFRKIKVDRSFVSGANIGRKSDAIIRAVAEMGATLDMDIVAEGLETLAQVQTVIEAGCTLGQGFYFSRPVPDYMAAILLAKEDEHRDLPRLVG